MNVVEKKTRAASYARGALALAAPLPLCWLINIVSSLTHCA